jgi:hypothetical protein
MKLEFVTLPSKALGLPFSSAVRAGDFLYPSGAIGNQPAAMTPVEGGLAQSRQAMENIGAGLRARGLGFADMVKFTIMLADMPAGRSSTRSISNISIPPGGRRARPWPPEPYVSGEFGHSKTAAPLAHRRSASRLE